MKDKFCNYIANLCIKSMLYEVAASPKPGLVDRHNSGAHEDMDFFTFLNSSSSLYPYFYQCSREGLYFQGNNYTSLLKNIRPIGIEAERIMFASTQGVNTHKGLIFSLGILAAASGSLYKENRSLSPKTLSDRVQEISQGVTKELKEAKGSLTYGEVLYKKYGITGIRGEVEAGFPTVLEYSLPVFNRLITEDKYHINTILVHTLLYLIAHTEDSNILGRHNMQKLNYAQKEAKEAIKLGGYLSLAGREKVKEMDESFIRQNISPGGAADLLAVTLMFHQLDNLDSEEII